MNRPAGLPANCGPIGSRSHGDGDVGRPVWAMGHRMGDQGSERDQGW